MAFVLDASITACWALGDEDDPHATMALMHIRTQEAWVPALWWFEVRNTLILNERRGRLSPTDTEHFLREVGRLGIVIDHALVEADVLALARRHRLTIYDASYLELARRCRLPLASLDADLVAAARAESLSILGE